MKKQLTLLALAGIFLGSALLAGCGGPAESTANNTSGGESNTSGTGEKLSGDIAIDGSSTVYKATAKVAESFMEKNPDVNIDVKISGTGGGFKKFAAGETDISNASRPIKSSEADEAKKNNVEFVEIPVGYDGITVVVNPKNTWVKSLTVEELKKMWEPNSTVKTWKDVRAEFPATPVTFYGPGTESGTFDYFTKVIVGEEKKMRTDFQASEDDNVILQGVAGDEGAIGYFGMAYWEQNKDKVTAIAIDSGNGPVEPSVDSVLSLTYQPLSRPEFIYIKTSAMDRPEVAAFVKYYLGADGQAGVKESGYVPFKPETYERILKIVDQKKTGSIFDGQTGKAVEDVLTAAGL